jgi:DNA-binding transcriptional LysR family regulator
MTQAAVSYAILGLEKQLGVRLFSRSHRKVVLTAVGSEFFGKISFGLTHIRQAIDEVRRPRASEFVTLSVSTAFANYWMLPRLADFRENHPDIDLRVMTTDKDVDIVNERIALGVRYAGGTLKTYQSALLAKEYIYPVCSPRYLERIAATKKPLMAADLTELTLIHLEEPFRPCPSWSDLFKATGAIGPKERSTLGLNDYALVIHAALEGQGLALGWHHLVDWLVARQLLVRPVNEVWDTGVEYRVVWSAQLSKQARTVRDWLVAEGERAAPTDASR